MKNRIGRIGYLLLIVSGLLILSGCGGDGDSLEDQLSTRVRAVNLAVDMPEVNVRYHSPQKTIEGVAYKDATAYASLRPWTTITFEDNAGQEIARLEEPDFPYDVDNTVYLVNRSGSYEVIQSEDEHFSHAANATIRFVQACADAPSIDLRADLIATPLLANQTFKDISDSILITPGEYNFIITEEGDSSETLARFESIILAADKVYTIILLGTLDETDAFELGIRVFEDTGNESIATDLSVIP